MDIGRITLASKSSRLHRDHVSHFIFRNLDVQERTYTNASAIGRHLLFSKRLDYVASGTQWQETQWNAMPAGVSLHTFDSATSTTRLSGIRRGHLESDTCIYRPFSIANRIAQPESNLPNRRFHSIETTPIPRMRVAFRV
jgi:hypothetical protein